MIPSVEWAKEYNLKVKRFSHLYKDFIKTKITELANKIIVDAIIEKMKANDVHEKIWMNTIVQRVILENDRIVIRIHSEYFADNGFDVALAREKGTEDHFIAPKGRGDQFTMSPEFKKRFGGAYALSWIQNGKRRFSMGHKVSGLPSLYIIEKTVEEKEIELQTRFNEELRKWKQSVFT